jgi:hypothetical protein
MTVKMIMIMFAQDKINIDYILYYRITEKDYDHMFENVSINYYHPWQNRIIRMQVPDYLLCLFQLSLRATFQQRFLIYPL